MRILIFQYSHTVVAVASKISCSEATVL